MTLIAPAATGILDPRTGQALDLTALLRGHDTLDLDVLLGCEERLPVHHPAQVAGTRAAQDQRGGIGRRTHGVVQAVATARSSHRSCRPARAAHEGADNAALIGMRPP